MHERRRYHPAGRILGAGCMLPLSKNVNLSRDLGMRHRAGIGMSENSDAVVVIVSEETGSISVAIGGMLKRHLMPETLRQLLRNELMPQPEEEPDKPRLSLRELLHAHRRGGSRMETKTNTNQNPDKSRKVIRIVISILVAIAPVGLCEPGAFRGGGDHEGQQRPVEFSGEDTSLAEKNLMLLSGYEHHHRPGAQGSPRRAVQAGQEQGPHRGGTPAPFRRPGSRPCRTRCTSGTSSAAKFPWITCAPTASPSPWARWTLRPCPSAAASWAAPPRASPPGELTLDPAELNLKGQRDDSAEHRLGQGDAGHFRRRPHRGPGPGVGAV